MMWRRWTSGSDKVETECELVLEIEAFLRGTYEQHLETRDISVPGWVRFNALAHGGLADVQRLAGSEPHEPAYLLEHPIRGWKAAQALIANDLIELVEDSDFLLRCIQKKLLVPLESCLMEEEELTALNLVIVTREVFRLSS